jgi:hypothetical protein
MAGYSIIRLILLIKPELFKIHINKKATILCGFFIINLILFIPDLFSLFGICYSFSAVIFISPSGVFTVPVNFLPSILALTVTKL